MSGVKVLRNRIKSVKSTQKITKAMRMVSAAKLHRAKESEGVARFFRDRIIEMLAAAKDSLDQSEISQVNKSILYKDDVCYNSVVIVYSSDRGLCGPFNSMVYRNLKKDLSEYKNLKIICIGKKIHELLVGKYNVIAYFSGITNTQKMSSEINRILIQEVQDNPHTEVIIYYTKFKNTLIQIPSKLTLIPVDIENTTQTNNLEFEGEGLLDKLIELYLEANIVANFYESKASEEASRMTAMDNATRNAGEMIDKLTLKMNRTRQAQITRELIEVISGAEAI